MNIIIAIGKFVDEKKDSFSQPLNRSIILRRTLGGINSYYTTYISKTRTRDIRRNGPILLHPPGVVANNAIAAASVRRRHDDDRRSSLLLGGFVVVIGTAAAFYRVRHLNLANSFVRFPIM